MTCLKLSRGPDFITQSVDNENQTCLQNAQGVTNPNTVLSLLFREPDVCQSLWWGGAQARTGVCGAGCASARVPEIRLFEVTPFPATLKCCHLLGLGSLVCLEIKGPQYSLFVWSTGQQLAG